MRLAVPVVEIAMPGPVPPRKRGCAGMVKVSDAETVRVPPTKTDPEHAQNPAMILRSYGSASQQEAPVRKLALLPCTWTEA